MILGMDLETFSDVDLAKCGLYRYVEGYFHILLLAYAFDDEPVEIIDLACGEEIPSRVKTQFLTIASLKPPGMHSLSELALVGISESSSRQTPGDARWFTPPVSLSPAQNQNCGGSPESIVTKRRCW